MPVQENFTEKFKIARNYVIIREFFGKTQDQIVKEIPIPKQNVSSWENGSSNPGKKYIGPLSNYFGLKPEVFYMEDLTPEYLESVKNNAPMPKEAAIPENDPREVYRKVVEGETEYLLIPRTALEGSYRLVAIEQITIQEKELERRNDELIRKDHQIEQLYELFKMIASGAKVELPKVEKT